MRSFRSFLVPVVLFAASLTLAPAAGSALTATYYVATNGSDTWSGTLAAPNAGRTDGPFASLARAQQAVRTVVGAKAATVYVRNGTYYLPLSPTSPGTLTFGSGDSGTASLPVVWVNYPGETAVVSGGVPIGSGGLGLTWTQVGTSPLWQVHLPATILPSEPLQPFETLYYTSGGTTSRRLRARVGSANGVGYYMNVTTCTAVNPIGTGGPTGDNSLCNLGTFLRMAGTIAQSASTCTGTNAVSDGGSPARTKCLERFSYNPSDPIGSWANLNGTYTGSTTSPCATIPGNPYPVGDVELTVFDAWTVDVMRVSCVDTAHHILYLTGPMKKSGGNTYDDFGPAVGRRYIVENAKDSFNAALAAGQTGLWFLDRSTSPPVLNYIANSGESPNSDLVVIPQLGGTIPSNANPASPAPDYIGGSLIAATGLSYVTFQGLIFEVDDFYPDPKGFNDDVNGEMSLPQAIDCEGCSHVTFENVTVRRTSASGLLVASSPSPAIPASNVTVDVSIFADLGDSGVRIGHTPQSTDTAAAVVHNVTVSNNLIKGFSRVFADGEGIAQGNGNAITYSHNDIMDGYHAGIVVCQLACPGAETGANGTNVTSQYNHLRALMQGITSDIGSLYYNVGSSLGSGSGNKILSNVVHDTTDASIIDFGAGMDLPGYGGHGIYLDAQTGGVDAEDNVVYRVSSYTVHITEGPTISQPPNPNRFANNIFSLGAKGMFILNQPWPAGCGAGPVVSFTSNVFNFDNSGLVIGGCTNSCGLDFNNFYNFQGNSYWRAGTGTSGLPLFCADTRAFTIVDPQQPGGSCPAGGATLDLTFDTPASGSQTWQYGVPPTTPVGMHEDRSPAGLCSYNPNFGTTGNPSDYLLTSTTAPPSSTGFDYTLTNDAIHNAGRTSGPLIPTVAATFPTYNLTIF